ncbi:phospholipase effector Tle1 domain-containing protein [Tritonibacter mobilis]|uniref:phospholipase effector Tle1 domain-containing protein n=1 Tax=Tritonibacter mobilis TaxID=379347 RepID=UPI0008068768|nr:DUF2235 domain-containing protein [Tritonibacter mobilis]
MADGNNFTALLNDAQAVNADESPSANAQVDAAVSTCPDVALNFGVFFDGTYNNAANVAAFNSGTTSQTGGSYDNYITNVARLSQQYYTFDDDVPNDCGQPGEAYRSTYVPGIGSSNGKPDDAAAGATGFGKYGLENAIEKATQDLREAIDDFGGPASIRSIKLDIFGFSRGAATARVFANIIAQGELANAEVRFLGLYDTVGSFGLPGDDTEYNTGEDIANFLCEVNLGLSPMCLLVPKQETADLDVRASTATNVFHIVGDDEFRAFFPLSSVKPGHGVEVVMPGCHGDVGGSSPPAEYFEETMNPPRFLLERGYWDNGVRLDIAPTNNVDRLMRNWDYKYRRTIEPGIWIAGYTAMLKRAQSAGVPLHSNAVTIPDDLKDLTALMIDGKSLPESERRIIRTNFVRMSHAGVGPNMLDVNGAREIYPNQP